jgi:hypothetical protein
MFDILSIDGARSVEADLVGVIVDMFAFGGGLLLKLQRCGRLLCGDVIHVGDFGERNVTRKKRPGTTDWGFSAPYARDANPDLGSIE